MKQPKKIFTRMLINNWGGISHKMLEFHEYVNLFSGKSGSGKSTVMDAIQVVLYGSVSANFLNKAADDSKNKRSVLSYLRGAQKDGTANRGDVDFCSQIVLEIEDTATHIVTCVGAAFEVAKGDTDLKKYTYFSHSGRIPKDEYLENNVPYSIAQIRKLTEERSRSADNRGRGEVNKVYPSKEAYLYTLYGEIFGQVEQGRMITMEKSAIALKMTSGTGQFIRDYMFPKTKEDTVATISEQLGAYREIKERVEDLEKRIEMLDKIQVYDRELTNVRAEKVRTETVLKCIDIEENIIRLKGRESELESVEKEADEAKKEQKILQDELQTIRDERARVQAELNNSDYGKKEQELKDLEYRIALLADNSAQWRQIVKGLKRWEEEDVVVILQAELVGVLLEGHAHRPRGKRLVGVVAAPHGVDGVQRGGGNGAVGLQADVALGAEKQQHIVGLAARVLTVCFRLRAFRKAEAAGRQAAQAFEAPEEDALDLAAELVREKGVILPVRWLFLHR